MATNVVKLSLLVKVSDLCNYALLDQNNNAVAKRSGYLPEFVPGDVGGDYLHLDIDLETGRIINWVAPTTKDLENIIDEGDDQWS